MSTTLIVRDAILAVQGAPDGRKDAREHLAERLEEVARMAAPSTEECLEVLLSAAAGKEPEPDIVESLLIVGLSHPHLAARKGFVPAAMGRRLAARLERVGESERAIAILHELASRCPGDAAIDRDLQALLRRHGMVQDLGDRYFERAMDLMREGRNAEAVGCLREVLQLDRGRKDAARLIRDLRLKESGSRRKTRIHFGRILWVLLPLAAFGAVGWREYSLYEEFRLLPEGVDNHLPAQEARLGALEDFTSRYPVWHGAILAVKERTQLRLEVRRLREEGERRVAEELQAKRLVLEQAEVARQRGLERAGVQDFESALREFRLALELAGDDWEHGPQVAAEIQAITDYLETGE